LRRERRIEDAIRILQADNFPTFGGGKNHRRASDSKPIREGRWRSTIIRPNAFTWNDAGDIKVGAIRAGRACRSWSTVDKPILFSFRICTVIICPCSTTGAGSRGYSGEQCRNIDLRIGGIDRPDAGEIADWATWKGATVTVDAVGQTAAQRITERICGNPVAGSPLTFISKNSGAKSLHLIGEL
jgi:hypothetical protein